MHLQLFEIGVDFATVQTAQIDLLWLRAQYFCNKFASLLHSVVVDKEFKASSA